jgi:broad specificity phosphatase PhoE
VLFVVRHGRTAVNAAGLLLGRQDPPLDEVGVAQADAMARALGSVDHVVCSPLTRCRATAERLSATAVEVDERWIELDYGEYEGMPLADVPASTWKEWRSDIEFRPPGGETLAELGARVREACNALKTDSAEGETIVVVSHVSPIKAAVAWALGVDDTVTWRLYVAPASVSRISTAGGRISLHGFNDVSALVAPG